MKKSLENISNIIRLSVFCLSIGLTFMSFTMPEKTTTSELEILDTCPTASFSVANSGCLVNEDVIFINQSISATSQLWDFGDGNTSTVENPRHAYQAAGTYTVTLTAYIDGCQHSFIGTVDVVAS